MKKLSLFLSALLAGMSVGFGGLVFLSAENLVIGAALFTAPGRSAMSFRMTAPMRWICL